MRQRPKSSNRSGAEANAGSKSTLEGDVWAVPVPRGGICPLVVARGPRDKAEVEFVFAYLQPTRLDQPPKPSAISPPETWGKTWLGLVSTAPFRKGRWMKCGPLPGFNRIHWPIPPSRHSAVNESEPVEQWERHPWGEMWSIETTADEPTMTIVANTPATREEALQFPSVDVVTAASSLEKALATHFAGRSASFWDMELSLNAISPQSLSVWIDFADRVRSTEGLTPTSWLPAGRKTDGQLKAGAWLGLPLTGGGFGAGMLVEKPPRHLRFMADAVVMAMRRRWDRWPSLEDVATLTPSDAALVTQTSMICVRDGRWRVLGYHDNFNPANWVWPRPFLQSPEGKDSGEVSVTTAKGQLTVHVDPAILQLDPHAGQLCGGMSSYGSIEADVPRIMAGTHWSQTGNSKHQMGIVTSERLATWRKINAALEQAIESTSKNAQ